MTKFKPGTYVSVTTTYGTKEYYIVVKLIKGGVQCSALFGDGDWYSKFAEFLPSELSPWVPPRFKVGDRVQHHDKWVKGTVVEVEGDKDEDFSYIVKWDPKCNVQYPGQLMKAKR